MAVEKATTKEKWEEYRTIGQFLIFLISNHYYKFAIVVAASSQQIQYYVSGLE